MTTNKNYLVRILLDQVIKAKDEEEAERIALDIASDLRLESWGVEIEETDEEADYDEAAA